jgi:hypothetical protein
MKIIKKLYNNIVTGIYKIDLIRTSVVLFRFIYFYYIKKNIKHYLHQEQKNKDHIEIHRDNKKFTVIGHNMHFIENLKNLKKTYKKFNGSKTASLIYPFKAIDFIDYNKNKILSVGPRNEGELFLIRSLGFNWKNIHSLDLISYSSLTDLGDIHKTTYSDSSFEHIICGWVLTYSNDFEKILDELLRIVKNKGLISIGFTYVPKDIDKKRIYDESSIGLNSTEQILKKFEKNIEHIYFNFDAKKNNPLQKRHSILILRVKK